jgi:hypothetical protein
MWMTRGVDTAGARDLLRRFRPAGTPGAAARPGVPVDRAAEAAAELAPVLARLAGVQAECGRLREQARRDAEELRQRAREQAAALVAAARERAAGERAEAAARARAGADAESARQVAEAERQATALRELAERRLPDYVARVVAMVSTSGAGEPSEAGVGSPS